MASGPQLQPGEEGEPAGLARRRPAPAMVELNDQASGARGGQQGEVGPPKAQRPLHSDGDVVH
eukprot:13205284-Alexandrium_andersonii.AAC.1